MAKKATEMTGVPDMRETHHHAHMQLILEKLSREMLEREMEQNTEDRRKFMLGISRDERHRILSERVYRQTLNNLEIIAKCESDKQLLIKIVKWLEDFMVSYQENMKADAEKIEVDKHFISESFKCWENRLAAIKNNISKLDDEHDENMVAVLDVMKRVSQHCTYTLGQLIGLAKSVITEGIANNDVVTVQPGLPASAQQPLMLQQYPGKNQFALFGSQQANQWPVPAAAAAPALPVAPVPTGGRT